MRERTLKWVTGHAVHEVRDGVRQDAPAKKYATYWYQRIEGLRRSGHRASASSDAHAENDRPQPHPPMPRRNALGTLPFAMVDLRRFPRVPLGRPVEFSTKD